MRLSCCFDFDRFAGCGIALPDAAQFPARNSIATAIAS
jgi:hypothetical protein